MPLFKSNNPHYQFNRHTLKYERVDHTFKYYLKKFSRLMILSLLIGVIFFIIFIFTIKSPNEKRLIEENNRIATQYEILSHRMDEASEILTIIGERDNNFYRVMLEADSIPGILRRGNYRNTARYDKWDGLKTATVVKETSQKMDEIDRMLYVQSNSFDELVNLAKNNEDKLQHIPAIQPILNKDLKRTASGYGRRIDPIYHTVRFHAGMDFSAPIGTEIFATGDGTVSFVGWKQGYGNCVTIDHGYDYMTLYGHISKFKKGLRKGQKVTRGDVIAYVGNTGKSTGPHLHYEVRLKGKPQNPQNYYFKDLSPGEYDEMVRLSSNSGKMFD